MRRARIFALTASVLIFVALVLGCATRIDFVIEKRVEDNRGPSPTRVEIGIDIRDLLLSQVSELHEFESGIQSAADDAVGEQVGSLLGTRFVWSIPLSFIPYFNVSLNLVMGNDPNEAEQYLADLQNESRYGRTIRRGAQEDEFQMALAKAAAGDTAIAVLKDWYQDAKSPGGVLNVANEDKLIGHHSGEPKPVTVVFGGDVVLCAEVEKRVERYGEGYVFKGMADLFSHADVVAINLENPLTNSDKKAPKPTPSGHEAPVYLKARPEAGKVLSAGGIDVAFLANNHIGDYEGGVVDTTKALRGLGILPVGAGENSQEAYRPVIVEVRGTKLAFLAFCDVRPRSFEAEDSRLGSAWAHPKAMQAAIAKARKGADVVFVNLHFGGQHNTVPSERQKQLAGLALRAGADMVIGNHPHVIQPVAVLQGKPVLFSLGNLVLPMPRYSWSIGLVAKVVIVGKKIRRVDLIPIQIVDLTQPQRIHGHHILDNLYESSKVFGDLQTIKNGFLLLETPLLPAVPKQPPSD